MLERLNSWLKKPFVYKIESIHIRIVRVLKNFTLFLFRPFFQYLLNSESGREIIYKSYPLNSLLISQKNNESYIVNNSDLAIGLSTFKREEAFEGSKFETALNLLPNSHKRSLFIDIGANIGNVGIHAVLKHKFNKCIAFEPDPNNYKLLEANIILNGVQSMFEKHNLALSSSRESSLEFELSDDNHGDHRVRLSKDDGKYNEANRKVIKVNCDCLDSYSSSFNSEDTLIWMDTQGFEGYVLSGAKTVLENSIPIVMEVWPYGLNRSNGFESLFEIFVDGKYTKMIDLENPNVELEFSRENFDTVVNRLNAKAIDSSTDIMLY